MIRIIKIFLFLFLFNFTYLNANEKITYLDIDVVIQNTIKGKLILKDLDLFKNQNNKDFKSREEKIRSRENDLINKKNILSKEEFESNFVKLKKDMDIFNKDRKDKNIEFQKKRKSMLDDLLKKITPLIERYVKDNSISLVLNKNNIFIGDKKFDITNDIINIVDKNIK
jgi:Skp family chaperone for outer membrane proteins|tara:strand:+ start:2499 stop:3005 length:507 start_codon:yes stop_codon:yes gene_type:complete